MKKLSPVLVLSLAITVACGGGGGATGPSAPAAPSGSVALAWAGTATRTMRVDFGVLVSTTTWEISGVTWVKDEGGEVVPLAGEALYKIGSGRVKETIRQVSGPCVVTGETEFALLPSDGVLVVGKTGTYTGSIRRRVEDPITVTGDCGHGAGSAAIGGQMHLEIDSDGDSTRAAGRLRGTKTLTVAASVHTSTWDFTATAWER